MTDHDEMTDRLQDIMNEMSELVEEALQIAQADDDFMIGERARSYWYAQIKVAIDVDNSGFCGSSMDDMAATLAEMKKDICTDCGEPFDDETKPEMDFTDDYGDHVKLCDACAEEHRDEMTETEG